MKHLLEFIFWPAIAAALLVTPTPAQDGHLKVLPVITEYFELVASGAYDIAGDMWTPEALERSHRFGITYTGIVLKQDCNSPVIRNLDRYRDGIVSPIRKYEDLEENRWYRLEFSDIYGSSVQSHSYYAQRRGDWFWLSYAEDFYGAGWPITESRYFRVHTDPGVGDYLNAVVLEEADRFVERTAARLGMSDQRLADIADKKIEYYYCSSDSVVQKLSGFLVKGTLDLASNDIISADFPHFHELSHLLVNIHLKELPLYVLPLVREGTAVYLGGRWGKHPAALLDLAIFLYREGLIEFDSTLTMNSFLDEAGADIVYPVTGVFSGFLIEELGMKKYLDLYLRLSGTFDEVNNLSAAEVGQIIADAAGRTDWASLKDDFGAYLDSHRAAMTMAQPGGDTSGKELISEDRGVVRDQSGWLAFQFKGTGHESSMQGNLVFGKKDELVGLRSSLFDSQYEGNLPFEGYRYGIRYDQNEVGLYDYATNRLMAKYIWGITPSDEYFDAEARTVRVRFRKDLLEGPPPGSGDYKLLPM